MEPNDTIAPKRKWYSIREAAEYLDVGEPTLYRWMREGKMTYRKVGDSTRFWQEDLDSVMEVFHSDKDLDKAKSIAPSAAIPNWWKAGFAVPAWFTLFRRKPGSGLSRTALSGPRRACARAAALSRGLGIR